MKKILSLLLAVVAGVAFAQVGSNYLSVQNPDWPPLPGPPSPTIEVFELEPGVFVMDDTQWKYAEPPKVTNSIPKWKDPVADFRFNTNALARRPQDLEFLKRVTRAMSPTNGLPRAAQLMIQRRHKAMFAEFDRVAKWGRENPADAAKLRVLDDSGKPLPDEAVDNPKTLSR